MKRRQFILGGSAAMGTLLPLAGRGAPSCPPAVLSATGGTQANTTCATSSGSRYSTNFDLTENPISDSNRWKNGLRDGLDWLDIRSANGIAFAAATVSDQESNFNDATACLTGTWADDQEAIGTVYVAPNYHPASNGINHEIELHVRCNIGPHSIRTYECAFAAGGPFIVRWNGPIGNITYLSITDLGYRPLESGQVLRATVVGNVISFYQDGTLICRATDSSAQRIASGAPGMAFFPRTGATLNGYAFSDFTGGNL